MDNQPPAPEDHHGVGPKLVIDTSVLLNLAKPVVDQANGVSGASDPLKKVLIGYNVIAPDIVIGEVTDQIQKKDGLLADAAETVLWASDYIESVPASDYPDPAVVTLGLDAGERAAISLSKARGVTVAIDEFGSSNLPLVMTALSDANLWTSTPELLCRFGDCGYMDLNDIKQLLSYYQDYCGWESEYVDAVKAKYI